MRRNLIFFSLIQTGKILDNRRKVVDISQTPIYSKRNGYTAEIKRTVPLFVISIIFDVRFSGA